MQFGQNNLQTKEIHEGDRVGVLAVIGDSLNYMYIAYTLSSLSSKLELSTNLLFYA